MLSVQTKCVCGHRAQLTRTKDGQYYVTCAACGRSGRNHWKTMTVAIVDWDDDMNALKKDNVAS